MPGVAQSSTNGPLTVTAYPGDGAVLLAFDLDPAEVQRHALAGFAIQYVPPAGPAHFLFNRLQFGGSVTAATTPAQRKWTPSDQAPIQKFHWVDFPGDVAPGTYTYRVTARYFQGNGLVDGPSASVAIELQKPSPGTFELGFTRGYLTSQAYAAKFANRDIRVEPKTLDFDTKPFEAQYQWLGFHARRMVYDLLEECVADHSLSVDLFAYDLDEPNLLGYLEQLGPRLRAYLDNAPLHVGTALEVQAHDRLAASAGAKNVKQGHFHRFAHDKIIIVKRDGKPIQVLTGSMNFSIRGIYVQANNVLRFDDPDVAAKYEEVFQEVFANAGGFAASALSQSWFDFPLDANAKFSVCFSPHGDSSVSLGQVLAALDHAQSSVLFAVMELGGGGEVLAKLRELHQDPKLFSYGMTQASTGFRVYKPGQGEGILVPFAALDKHVPPPFDKEWRGGPGQVIHDKFIVIDFNGPNPIVFTGSSNLADGGEKSNGDNLLMIRDPEVAAAFAIEALRLVDHYEFRAAMQQATDVKPLMLQGENTVPHWWEKDYAPDDIHFVMRDLLAQGAAAGAAPVARSAAKSPALTTRTGTNGKRAPIAVAAKPAKRGKVLVTRGAKRKPRRLT